MGSWIPKAKCRSAKGLVEQFLVKRAKAQGTSISFDGWEYADDGAGVPMQGMNDCGVWLVIMHGGLFGGSHLTSRQSIKVCCVTESAES